MNLNSRKLDASTREAERVFLVSLQLKETSEKEVDSSLGELARLIDTLGGIVVGKEIQKRQEPNPAFFIGKGKAEEIGRKARDEGATLVAIDHELSGSQQKNLEKILDLRVIDRTGVILDIFSRHARTKESKNQV